MKFKQALKYATDQFKTIGLLSPDLDARLLLSFATNCNIEYLLCNSDTDLTEVTQQSFEDYVNRRMNFEPIAYIVGFKEFYGFNFIINNNVLIPRADSEILIDAVLDYNCINDERIRILELGVGSGCLIITLLLKILSASAIGIDINPDSIICAHANSIRHFVNERIELIESFWFNNVPLEKFDFIISNPPYIARKDIGLMSQETILHEPESALFALYNGLDAYKHIALGAKHFLTKIGKLFLEIGFNQANAIIAIFTAENYVIHSMHKDLSGRVRILCFIYNTKK
jgi:release factor glutamine methyltransferase